MTEISHDNAAAVDRAYFWNEVSKDMPMGVKLQLIERRSGVACYGMVSSLPCFWTHWAPLPTFQKKPALLTPPTNRLYESP